MVPAFDVWMRAVWGYDPYPWQRRLAEEVRRTGRWPTEIGVPTGLGKTACLDVAVWWLAAEGLEIASGARTREQRTVPTRIWWVVNRQVLVDAATVRAERIAAALADPARTADPPAVAQVAAGLRALASVDTDNDPTAAPLVVRRLRGGISLDRPPAPHRPAVILSTVPMFGSRLLFRGYGSTRSLWPIEAALAGTDGLLLLDEAHLAPHLDRLLDVCADIDQPQVEVLPAARKGVRPVRLTATGAPDQADRFDLDDTDRADPRVARLLAADRPLHLVDAGQEDALPKRIAQTVRDALGAGRHRVLVFCSTPERARAVAAEVAGRDGIDPLVLTGELRGVDAELRREQVVDPVQGLPADASAPPPRPVVVVATQTLEVGADLDAEVVITDPCGVRALTQRLGRLNRRGLRPGAYGVYVHYTPTKGDYPVYGGEPQAVWERLTGAAEDGVVDLSPTRIAQVLGAPSDTPPPAPELLPALLDEWTATSMVDPDAAPVEPYFSGDTTTATATVIWRAYIPQPTDGVAPRLWPPLTRGEEVEVPLGEVRDVVRDRSGWAVLGVDGTTVEPGDPERLRPGAVVILPCTAGHYDRYGWSPEPTPGVVVPDLSVLVHGLPLDAAALAQLVAGDLHREVDAVYGAAEEEVDVDAAVAVLLQRLREATPRAGGAADWQAFLDRLDPSPVFPEAAGWVAYLPVRQAAPDTAEEADDELDRRSLTPIPVPLTTHLEDVARLAAAAATVVGLPTPLREAVRMAGWWHDAGKADPRFQRWLDPQGQAGTLLAKSATPPERWETDRVRAGWPRGGRHEALSGRLWEAWCAQQLTDGIVDEELVGHLIRTHHGQGRPLILPVDDGAAPPLQLTAPDGRTVTCDGDLAAVDWSQPRRFRTLSARYGRWGLALLEAVVRAADWEASARHEERTGGGGSWR